MSTESALEDDRHNGRNCFVGPLKGRRGEHAGDVVGYVVIGSVRVRYWMCARHFIGSLRNAARGGFNAVPHYLADPEGENANHTQV